MPIVIFAGCASAIDGAATSAAARTRRWWVRMLVPVDLLLRVDPFLEVAVLDALRLGLDPGVVRVLRPAGLFVEDAEVDERLRRVAVERLERGDVGLRQRQRRLVHRDAALRVVVRVLLGGGERLRRRADLAVAPLLERDQLVRRPEEVPDLRSEPGLVLELREVRRGLLARRQRAHAV